jgi:hypothetical protein
MGTAKSLRDYGECSIEWKAEKELFVRMVNPTIRMNNLNNFALEA